MDENRATTSALTKCRKRAMPSQDDPPLHNCCVDYWMWNKRDKSHEVRIIGENFQTAFFHPNWSNGTAGVRGTRILNRGRYYWEINVTRRIFGTSMMFGIGTNRARLHVDAFVNMLGEDDNSWGLSHKGLVWHKGIWRQFTKPFRENEATTIGLLFDGIKGTLTYYKDGINLGVAFSDLHLVEDELYPIICSTAAKTEMSLGAARREFISLQDRCRTVILNNTRKQGDIGKLNLPNAIKMYLIEEADHIRILDSSCKCSSDNIYCTQSGIRVKKYLMV